jgi:hypothetical protein
MIKHGKIITGFSEMRHEALCNMNVADSSANISITVDNWGQEEGSGEW